MAASLPKISHVLETCLYVRSAPKSAAFYQKVFDLKPHFVTERMASLPLGNTTLLLFTLGRTGEDIHIDEPRARGVVPHHGPTSGILEMLAQKADGKELLKQHFCFAVETVEEVRAWEGRLGEFAEGKGEHGNGGKQEETVKILGTMDWERGARSVYFEDLDGHVGEIGARGIWPHW